MIKIETEKIVGIDGIAKRKIISIQGVKYISELPDAYLQSNDYFYRHSRGAGIEFRTRMSIYIGDILEETNFQQYISAIQKAGKVLSKINKEVVKLRKEWQGNETYIV